MLSLSRLLHYHKVFHRQELNVDQLTESLVLLILANGFHWGLLSAWLIVDPDFERLHYPLMIVLAAFALAGTVTLSISHVVRILYPLCVYSPTIIVLILLRYHSEYIMLASLALISLVYIIDAAKITSRDYWEAIQNHQIAIERATQLEFLSITDPLTQLNNRMYFNDRYQEEWTRCSRLGVPVSVLMVDLDHFKTINDNLGHFSGDECLRQFAVTLREHVPRKTDVVARYGGEEFIIMLTGTDLERTQQIAGNLVKATAEMSVQCSQKAINMTCSIGIACTVPDYRKDSESLLHAADNALYMAKSKGRNQWVSAAESAQL